MYSVTKQKKTSSIDTAPNSKNPYVKAGGQETRAKTKKKWWDRRTMGSTSTAQAIRHPTQPT
jgi:hypothetical protein